MKISNKKKDKLNEISEAATEIMSEELTEESTKETETGKIRKAIRRTKKDEEKADDEPAVKANQEIELLESEEGMTEVEPSEGKSKKEKKHKKFKFTKKRVIAFASTALVLGFIVTRTISAAAAASAFDAATVKTGNLVSTVELNGTIESDVQKSFYADIEGKIGKICLTEGEAVKKGDVLISYDAADLEYRTEQAALEAKLKEENYTDKVQSNNRIAGMYSEAAGSVKTLDQQILIYKTAIAELDAQIEDKRAALADEGANLQISLIDWEDQPDSDEYENLRKLVQRNSYEQGHNEDLVEMETTRSQYMDELSELKQKKAEMESQKKSSYTSMLTEAGKESLETGKEADTLAAENNTERLEAAKNGIVSDINGVVTKVYTKEGSTEAQGRELVTVESTDDMVVRFRVGKYDIENLMEGQTAVVTIRNNEYVGKITKIDKKVTKDEKGATGVSMEITLDNPDENIILGLEAKAKIDALSRDNVLMIPKKAIYSDAEGEYVYTVRDGKAVKTVVEVGIYNSEDIEIKSGLSEGDTVILAGDRQISEGMDIHPNMIDEE